MWRAELGRRRKHPSEPDTCKEPHPGNVGKTSFLFRFPGGSDGKASAYNAEDQGSIPALGRSPGEANGNPLQYSCLENPMHRGAW